jgi:type I restriction enzyme S subunit
MENGKIAVVPPIQPNFGAGSTEFHVLDPVGVHPRYLFHWLTQRWFREQAEFNMTGTAGQKRVPKDYLQNALIPVPSPETQGRIATCVDELFVELDDAEDELRRARGELETYRKSLLKAAVTGDLTAEWRQANPPSETGDQLLNRILVDRRARWEANPKNRAKRYKEPIRADTSLLPALPEDWVWATIDQLCPHITSGSRAWAPYYDRGNCVFIMAQNVRAGRYDRRTRQLVDPPANDPERARTKVQGDDLLLTIVGANTGDLCRIDFDPVDHFVCQSVALLRPHPLVSAALIEAFFAGSYGRQLQMEKMIYGQGRPHLSFDQIRSLAVPLPPHTEIQPVLSAMHPISSLHSNMDAVVGEARLASDMLRQSILAAAFRGELVQ